MGWGRMSGMPGRNEGYHRGQCITTYACNKALCIVSDKTSGLTEGGKSCGQELDVLLDRDTENSRIIGVK